MKLGRLTAGEDGFDDVFAEAVQLCAQTIAGGFPNLLQDEPATDFACFEDPTFSLSGINETAAPALPPHCPP